MSYVDAGYAIALGTLAVYAVTLVMRRRRLERSVRRLESPPSDRSPSENQPPHRSPSEHRL